jgi:hypothetical protein
MFEHPSYLCNEIAVFVQLFSLYQTTTIFKYTEFGVPQQGYYLASDEANSHY